MTLDQNQYKEFTPEEFEILCKTLAIKWSKKNLGQKNYEIFYRKYKPVDIVIIEKLEHLPLMGQVIFEGRKTEIEHFLECKLYSNNLSLDTLGKSYLMVLRYKPKTLTIATNSTLSKGAKDFANWLSHELNDFTCSIWNPLGNNSPKIEDVNISYESYKEKYIKPYSIENWQLFEEHTFGKSPIADNRLNIKKKDFILNTSTKLLFQITLSSNIITKKIPFITLTLNSENDNVFNIRLECVVGIGNDILASGYITHQSVNQSLSFDRATLHIDTVFGADIIQIANFPIISINNFELVIPNLREKLTQKLYNKWIKDEISSNPILLLSGEGGIGKSYLCEEICSIAKRNGFRVAHTPLSYETQAAFINDLLWLILPEELRAILLSNDHDNFTSEFLQTFFEYFGGSYNKIECQALRDIISYDKWKEIDTELVMSAIIRVISTSPNKLILVLSNCHRMSNSSSQTIKSLFAALEANSWAFGKIKVILEYRDTKEDSTFQWERLQNWIKTNISKSTQSYNLTPITQTELYYSLKSLIVSTDNENAAKLIINKSGGNPLYIKMLLYSLHEHNFLTPLNNSDNNYSITSLSDLKSHTVELSNDIESILMRRLNYWHKKLQKDGNKIGGFLLGISAILGLEISLDVISKFTNELREKIETVLLKLQSAGFVERFAENKFRFSHEYILASSLKWVHNQSETFEKIQSAVTFCAYSDFETSFAGGRLNRYLGRQDKAIESYNAALQFSSDNFGRMFLCHKEILNLFNTEELSNNKINLFHANLKRTIVIGDYLASNKELITFNEIGISALKMQSIDSNEKQAYYRQYHHNISHTSLKTYDLERYFLHANKALEFSQSNIELAQVLNRMIKCASLLGDFEIGRNLGILGLKLQEIICMLSEQSGLKERSFNVVFGI